MSTIGNRLQTWQYKPLPAPDQHKTWENKAGARVFLSPKIEVDKLDLSTPEKKLTGIKITRKALEDMGTAAYQVTITGAVSGAAGPALSKSFDFVRSSTSEIAKLDADGSKSTNPQKGAGTITDHEMEFTPTAITEKGSRALFQASDVKFLTFDSIINAGDSLIKASSGTIGNGADAPVMTENHTPLGSQQDDLKMGIAGKVAATLMSTPDMDFDVAGGVMERIGAALQNDTTIARLNGSTLADMIPREERFIQLNEETGEFFSRDGNDHTPEELEALRQDAKSYLEIAGKLSAPPTFKSAEKKKAKPSFKPASVADIKKRNNKMAKKLFGTGQSQIAGIGSVLLVKDSGVSSGAKEATADLLKTEAGFEYEVPTWLQSIDLFGSPSGKGYPRGNKLPQALFELGLEAYPDQTFFGDLDEADRAVATIKNQTQRLDRYQLEKWVADSLPDADQAKELGIDQEQRTEKLQSWLQEIEPMLFGDGKTVKVATLQDEGDENTQFQTRVIMGKQGVVVFNTEWEI